MLTGGREDEPIVVWKNIGWLRGLAICLVAFNHGTKYSIFLAKSAHYHWSWPELVIMLLGRCAAPVCIPIFLVASGYFLGRFSATWKAALGGVKTFAIRYACWSLVIYACKSVLTDEVNWSRFLFGFFIAGQAYPTYWFCVVMIHFYLLTPWLTRLVTNHAKAALAVAATLLTAALTYSYLGLANYRFLPSMYLTPFVAPYFILGLFFAKRCDQIVAKFRPYRTLFGVLTLVFAVVNVSELVFLGHLIGDGSMLSWPWDVGDRLGIHLFAICGLFWFVLAPARNNAIRRALDWIGMRSLALLLCLDFFMRIAFISLWHGQRILGLTTRPASVAPPWIGSAWVSLPLTAVAIAAPLAATVLTERFFGRRVRTMIFG
jgi:hypothetical protein